MASTVSSDQERYEDLRNQSQFQAQELQRATEQIQQLQTKIEYLENDLRSKEYEIARLKNENERAREEMRMNSVNPFGGLRHNQQSGRGILAGLVDDGACVPAVKLPL